MCRYVKGLSLSLNKKPEGLDNKIMRMKRWIKISTNKETFDYVSVSPCPRVFHQIKKLMEVEVVGYIQS